MFIKCSEILYLVVCGENGTILLDTTVYTVSKKMVEPEIVSEAIKKTWRREAICLSVQVLNILVILYTVYLSFNAHSVKHSVII